MTETRPSVEAGDCPRLIEAALPIREIMLTRNAAKLTMLSSRSAGEIVSGRERGASFTNPRLVQNTQCSPHKQFGKAHLSLSQHQQEGLLFVVSAPSGAGKTTLCKAIVPQVPRLRYAVSYTTRSPRNGEIHGKDYCFVDVPTFQAMIERNDFIEWAHVHGNLYGTSRRLLQSARDEGMDVILDLDTQGAATLRKNGEGISIYILPPSLETLSERLVNRQSDSKAEIERRLQKSREEILHYKQYDYVIVNADFNRAQEALKAIIFSERVRMRQINPLWIEAMLQGESSRVGN